VRVRVVVVVTCCPRVRVTDVGDSVNVDDVVVVIETDKLAVEVRASVSGTLTAQHAKLSDTVEVGKPLLAIAPGAVAASKPAAAAAPASAPAAAAPASKAAAPPAPAAAKAASTTKPAAATAPKAPVGARTETRVQMSMMRSRIAQRLKEAQNTTAMLTTFQEVVCVVLTCE
jgi:2-oxoglutarate dehydrogenase E2 component (dihydrolipoamide succinyltransferase)